MLPRPLMLPDSIANGDYILFDAMGAYTVSSRSPFNGYYPDSMGGDWLTLPRSQTAAWRSVRKSSTGAIAIPPHGR